MRSNPVDPDSRVEKEVSALVENGYNVEILAWDRHENYKLKESYLNLDAGVVKIYRFGIHASFGGGFRKNLIPLLIFQMRLLKWLVLNRESYDIIHACDYDTAFVASKVAKFFRKKMIYDIFDYYIDSFNVPKILKRIIEKSDTKIINFADATIICTEKRKEQIKNARPKKLVVIHNTPRQSPNIPIYKLNESKVKIVYVGILAKGRFLTEITETIIKDQDFEFHVGGFGELESYFEIQSEKYSNIFFYGKIPYSRTLELENSCDIMTAIYDPSIKNHFFAAPNKFYESLMLGKPIIMAYGTGMSNIVEKEKIGRVIEYDAKSFEEAIHKMAQDKSEWESISRKMKELYSNQYCWDVMEERLIEIYKVL